MSNVKKVIVVFNDDTTEETNKFCGEFHFDDDKKIISENMTIGELFFAIRKMEYLINREFENQMKEVK